MEKDLAFCVRLCNTQSHTSDIMSQATFVGGYPVYKNCILIHRPHENSIPFNEINAI